MCSGVGSKIEGPQPRLAGAAPERSLIDGRRETSRRGRGQRPHIARPGDIEKITGSAAHAHDLDTAPQPGKRPIERAREPGRSVLVARRRGTAPGVGAVEEPYAAKAELRGDCLHVGHIGGARAPEPPARECIMIGSRLRAGGGSQARQSSRRARARPPPSMACRTGPPSRASKPEWRRAQPSVPSTQAIHSMVHTVGAMVGMPRPCSGSGPGARIDERPLDRHS